MKLRLRNGLALLLTLALLLGCLPQISALAGTEATAGTSSVNKTALSLGNSNEKVEIMVMLDGETTYVKTGDLELAAASADRQLTTLQKAELTIEKKIAAQIEVENFYSLLFNGFSFTGEAWMVDAINQIPGYTAFESPMMELIEPEVSEEESTLTPTMYTSTGLIGADKAWNYGYTGEGMVVAILDTGIRQTHEAFSVMPENGKIDKDYLKEVFEKYGDKIHAGNGEYDEGMYYNEKLPFNWDYFDGDAIPNHTASDHGTHVAGIAAGNNGKGFQGVAPDAQIVVMQVFNSSGGASFATLMLAMEDCVYLGVDALNMSLGVTAGFTAYEFVSDYMENIYNALDEAGIAVCVAAGNDNNAGNWTNFGNWFSGTYRYLASNPDVGLISAPASFAGSFAVGSAVNTDTSQSFYLNIDGTEYFPSAVSGNPTFKEIEENTYEFVNIGFGTPEEIEAAGGVEGKIAISKRGSLSFTLKCQNAAAAGAIGIIIYNNVSGSFNPSVTSTIPFAWLTLEDGEKIVASMTDNVCNVRIIHEFSYNSAFMARDSSWGTTSDLKIKPEITAPGENITSAIGAKSNDSYDTWSGTSMATPHISGAILLIKERLNKLFPQKSASEINELAYALLMSTSHQINGFVRQQGAGLIDIDSALRTDAYLSVPGQTRPKLELGDSASGRFTFSFVINNFGDSQKTYVLDYSALTEEVSDFYYEGAQMMDYQQSLKTGFFIANPEGETLKVINGTVKDVTELCKITAPETVIVPVNGRVTVEVTLSCTSKLKSYFKENCEAGMYLEGFIKLIDQDEDGVDLSIPYLGYVGDWDEPAMFDSGYYWMRSFGVNNLQTTDQNSGRYVGYGTLEQQLGLNYYADATGQPYLDDRNAISPNGDGLLETVDYLEFSLLRNAKTIKFYIQDENGELVENLYEGNYLFRKAFKGSSNFYGFTLNFDASEMEENETVYLVFEAWLEHDGYDPANNADGRWVIPVTKDTIAPAVKVIENGIQVIDTNYTAYYAIYADEERTELIYENGVFATERGVAETYLTDLDCFYVFTADYGRNEAFYKVESGAVYDLGWKHESRFFAGQEHINYAEGTYEYGWVSINTDDPGGYTRLSDVSYEMTEEQTRAVGSDIHSTAIAADGTLYANTIYTLYTIDPSSFERTKVADFWMEGSESMTVKNIMTNPETFEIYAYSYSDYGWYFCKLNETTGELTRIWKFYGFDIWAMDFYDADTVLCYSFYGNELTRRSMTTGKILETFDLGTTDYKYNRSHLNILGSCGDILFDREANIVYISSNWGEFRHSRGSAGGYVQYDFNTDTTTLHNLGNSGGIVVMGLFLPDEVKPAAFYTVMQLIDAIGEVTLGSGEAIDAAREAYDKLTDKEKSYVTNYEDLVAAEKKLAELREQACADGDHEYGEWTIVLEPTCDSHGIKTRTCVHCGATETVRIEKTEHSYKDEVVAPTCESMGYTTHTCEHCGHSYTDSYVPALEHEYEQKVTKAPTCSEFGELTYTCKHCGKSYTEVLPKTEHSYKDEVVAPTCDEMGYTVHTCEHCGYSYIDSFVPALGHDFKQTVTKEPTCTEEGEWTFTCTHEGCDESYTMPIPKIDHEMTEIVVEPTCEGYGYTVHKCEHCDFSYISDLTQPTGHVHTEIVGKKDADCKHDGYTGDVVCSDCGKVLEKGTVIPAHCPSSDYKDVSRDAWYHDAVDFMVENGIMQGYEDGTFRPNRQMTRAEFVQMLYNMFDEEDVSDLENPFKDVKDGFWAHDAIVWAASEGYVNGLSEDTFGPNETITREQIITILYRILEEPTVEEDCLADFADANAISDYAKDAMNWAVSEGILEGDGGKLRPRDSVTRAEVATIIMRVD